MAKGAKRDFVLEDFDVSEDGAFKSDTVLRRASSSSMTRGAKTSSSYG